jgi:hypothetical protein
MRKISVILITLLLSGCASLPSLWGDKEEKNIPPPPAEVKVVTKPVPLKIYQPPLPSEISLENVDFFVITKDNFDEQSQRIEKMLGGEFVVMALTPQGYENMAYNLQEIRRYIRQQKEIILYYREATKSEEGTTAEEWLNKNEEVVEEQQKQ